MTRALDVVILIMFIASVPISYVRAAGEDGACHAPISCDEEYGPAGQIPYFQKECDSKTEGQEQVLNLRGAPCTNTANGGQVEYGFCVQQTTGPGEKSGCHSPANQALAKKLYEQREAQYHADKDHDKHAHTGGAPAGNLSQSGGPAGNSSQGGGQMPAGHNPYDGHTQAQHNTIAQQQASAPPEQSAGQSALQQAYQSGNTQSSGGGASGGASGGAGGGPSGGSAVSTRLGGGSDASGITRMGSFSGIAPVAELIAGFLRPARRDSEPIVIETFAPVYLISASPDTPRPAASRVARPVAPRDPNKPLTREEIFRLAQHDTGYYRGEGDVYYLPQSTFGDASFGVGADGSVRAYGSKGAPGFDPALEGDPNAAPRGAPGVRGAVFRLLAGGGPADSGAGACSGFADCVAKGFSVVARSVSGEVPSSREGGGTGDLGQADVLDAEHKAQCIRSPQECLRSYVGRGPQLPDEATIMSGFDGTAVQDLSEAIVDPFNLPSYPQDTVVKACYDDACLYGVTGIDHALDINLAPAAFGVPTTTPLSLNPIAIFSSSAMAQAVAAILNGGFTLEIAIQDAAQETGGRPLYVVPEGVAFAPPLSELQLRAFFFYTPPAPWAPGTSVLNIQ